MSELIYLIVTIGSLSFAVIAHIRYRNARKAAWRMGQIAIEYRDKMFKGMVANAVPAWNESTKESGEQESVEKP